MCGQLLPTSDSELDAGEENKKQENPSMSVLKLIELRKARFVEYLIGSLHPKKNSILQNAPLNWIRPGNR